MHTLTQAPQEYGPCPTRRQYGSVVRSSGAEVGCIGGHESLICPPQIGCVTLEEVISPLRSCFSICMMG